MKVNFFTRTMKHRAAIFNVAMLYAGKTSGVLVALFFLPLYSRLLGTEQFGIVAVILSLQALLIMLDLGMSTLISRDVATRESSPTELLKLIRTAESSLAGFYLILLISTACFTAFGGFAGVDFVTALAAVTLFLFVVLHNIYYSAMLARRLYTSSSLIQAIGVIIRAGCTAFVLKNGYATLTAFVFTQLILAAVHCGVTRWYCVGLLELRNASTLKASKPRLLDGISLLNKGRSLVLFSAAGAAVMQLDKPLVTAFMSATSVAPYFLATTLCMLPLSILAGPISQYYQPALLNAATRKDPKYTSIVLKKFVTALLLILGLPCIIFWFFRVPMIEIWMGANPGNSLISRYVAILLPGCALGALGFIPYTLLLSEKDFKFQAILSLTLTAITLSAAAVAASFKSVEGVCYVYAAYHSTSTLSSWVRASVLPSTRGAAKYSFLLVAKCGILLIILAIVFNYSINLIII